MTPTQEGWYWVYPIDSYEFSAPQIIYLWQLTKWDLYLPPGTWVCKGHNWDFKMTLAETKYRWVGPLQPPLEFTK